jgi:diguanylate cyclase (GGDEF)-like protein
MKGFDAGSVDYISKPFWESEVLARVSAHLRLRRAQKEREAANAQLRLEVEQRRKAEQALEEANRHLADANARLEQANRRLQDLASEDGLTGIPNRRRLDEHLNTSWLQMVRQAQPLSVILCDIDYFKLYNDHYGHQAGDECLRAVARCIRSALRRPGDLAGRYGGEEFLVTLPHTDLAGALIVSEEIHEAVRRLQIPHERSQAGAWVSLSMGVSGTVPARGDCLSRLIAAADAALYEAKAAGRARSHTREYMAAQK